MAARRRRATTMLRSRRAPRIALRPRPISRSCAASARCCFTEFHRGRCARRYLPRSIPKWCPGLRSMPMVWTGEGSPTLADRRKRLPEYQAKNRRPIDRAFVRSIFTRDHPGTADDTVIEAFADAILKLDDSVPTGTYVDMCANLPVCNPEKITVPTLIMRGEYDGIASLSDLLKFFEKLPNPDKQLVVMPGIAHASFHQKNYMICYHLLASFFAQPEPVYRGSH